MWAHFLFCGCNGAETLGAIAYWWEISTYETEHQCANWWTGCLLVYKGFPLTPKRTFSRPQNRSKTSKVVDAIVLSVSIRPKLQVRVWVYVLFLEKNWVYTDVPPDAHRRTEVYIDDVATSAERWMCCVPPPMPTPCAAFLESYNLIPLNDNSIKDDRSSPEDGRWLADPSPGNSQWMSLEGSGLCGWHGPLDSEAG